MLGSRVINAVIDTGVIGKKTARGTPLLCLVVVNDILQHFKDRRTKVVAYADDIAKLITGKFVPTISDLMESAPGDISTWAGNNGLGINPSKMVLVLFTRNTKIPDF